VLAKMESQTLLQVHEKEDGPDNCILIVFLNDEGNEI
jgi:hypothetical protein